MDPRRLHATFPSSSMKDVQQFQKVLPSVSAPAQIGFFSLSYVDATRREFHDDDRGLRVLIRRPSCPLSLDLKEGYGSYRKFDEGARMKEHLDHFLRWILLHPTEFLAFRSRVKVVCVRGSLTDLMVTPYEKKDGWIVCVCRIDGVLYLTEFETDQDVCRRDNETEEKERYMYWGYKFEQYIQSAPTDEAALQEPINNSEGFHSVIYGRLSDTGILLVAEMDCLDPLQPVTSAPFCYVELKTTKLFPGLDLGDKQTFLCGPKLLKFWAQSVICGVPRLLIGFRNENGIVQKTEEVLTEQIPLLAKAEAERNGSRDGAWKKEVCLNFLDGFLKFVRQVVVKDHDKAVYKFEWSPGKSGVSVTEEAPASCWRFIPEWYVQSRPGLKTPATKTRHMANNCHEHGLLYG